ncbi:MAG TPA: 3-ketoacyl-ACP reductase [Planctomycetota bacterium]|nr:3-ketoacyl-ACP reductase [Planctomycetota bacterium]
MSDSDKPVALVTGGSRGIGRGICVALASLGWRVGINYTSNAPAAQETLELLKQVGGSGEAVQGDIGSTPQRKYLVDFMLQRFGRLDALVNNAGVAPEVREDLLEASEVSFDRVMNINLKGPYFLTQLAARAMIEQVKARKIERGYIVNISSVSAYAASPNRGDYCLSKAGMAMMTRLFATRLAAEKIYVFEVRPGVIATDMTGAVKAKYDKLLEEGLAPIKRWGQPEDVGVCVAAILRGDFPYSTGQVFDVDGGFHLQRL